MAVRPGSRTTPAAIVRTPQPRGTSLTALLALHVIVGSVIVVSARALGRRATALAIVPSAATLVWLVTQLGTVTDGVTRFDTSSRAGISITCKASS